MTPVDPQNGSVRGVDSYQLFYRILLILRTLDIRHIDLI